MARLICCSAGSAKKRSTWLIQDEDVGVKWICQRLRLGNQARMSLVFWLAALSMTTWMSRLAGTFRSTSPRNLRNSRARWRGHALSIAPAFTSQRLSAFRHSRPDRGLSVGRFAGVVFSEAVDRRATAVSLQSSWLSGASGALNANVGFRAFNHIRKRETHDINDSATSVPPLSSVRVAKG